MLEYQFHSSYHQVENNNICITRHEAKYMYIVMYLNTNEILKESSVQQESVY